MIELSSEIDVTLPTLYRNRTFTYVLPVIKEYGIDYIKNFTNINPVAYTVGDMSHDKNYIDNNYLYITVSINSSFKYNKKVFEKEIYQKFSLFRENLKNHNSYVTEYPQGNIQDNIYTFVINIPKGYENLKSNFLNGYYSKMYTTEQLNKLIPKKISDKKKGIEVLTIAYQVLNKSDSYKYTFVSKVNNLFNTNLTINDLNDGREYDLKPQLHQEILNYNFTFDNYKIITNE
jgi:hypothetical protein